MNEQEKVLRLADGWDNFWATITAPSGAQTILDIATFIGFAIIVWATIMIVRGRGGGGGGMKRHLNKLVFGAVLAAPMLLKLVLILVDFAGNFLISIFNHFFGS